ncbi:MAG: hypothetical protein SGPRY_006995 [Prymnesium sp.]
MFDLSDEEEHRWARCFHELGPTLLLPTDAAISRRLHQLVDQGDERDVVCGLLHAMLHDSSQTTRLFYHLCCCTRDGLAYAIEQIEAVALWRYHKLAQSSKQHLLLLTSRLIEVRAKGAERLVTALLRQVGTGNSSNPTLWLCDNLLSLLIHHMGWLVDASEIVPGVLLSFLRLAAHHPPDKMQKRREREMKFCTDLWAARSHECLMLGADLRLALYPLRQCAVLEPLRAHMRTERQLSSAPARPHDLRMRVTPNAERCVLFMLENLYEEEPRRHLIWFAERHLSNRGVGCIQDLLRWLCAGVALPSQTRVSGRRLFPRWMLAAWLLGRLPEQVADADSQDEVNCARWSVVIDMLCYHEHALWLHREPALLMLAHCDSKELSNQVEHLRKLLEALIQAPGLLFPEHVHACCAAVVGALDDFDAHNRIGQASFD